MVIAACGQHGPEGASPRDLVQSSIRVHHGKVLVVAKRSVWQEYLEGAKEQSASVIPPELQHRLERAHRSHEETLEEVARAFEALGLEACFQVRGEHPAIDAVDLVVTVGGDGTLLWVAHEVGFSPPVLAINSAPEDSVGHFCAGRKGEVFSTFQALLSGKLPSFALPRMAVEVDGKLITQRVLNEALFAHFNPAATTRYVLSVEDGGSTCSEAQRSSGVWVGPSPGSTAAQRSAGGRVLPPLSRRIQFVVREPYVADWSKPRHQALRLRKGTIPEGGRVRIFNQTREAKIFIDGPYRQVDVSWGGEVVFRPGGEPLVLFGYPRCMGAKGSGL
ncbi:MAG: NAD(+)/NADH kinase [Sandaracinaceae bacterium]|nr:NAD(+)/NADH kinase [Sandaracinaceae bacterium]